ncbi:bifunctional 4-hydroxy-2-oxoglutarate aldolase/2-dehydro-3-deoxy-phosphogluconate aldolase [Natronosporangium hydrolyticum]|nr:bifunctional 4-hydroxy-2-oxoglutarate aldolase/2-dehydro-3-deoxy-phosphogluconate aldolase [Natronosporangium hydrolyticum]
MVILRGLPSPTAAVAAASRAWDSGVELVEVPVERPELVSSLAAVVAAGAERGKGVGAGTVITGDQVRAAAAAGAQYTVAPGLDLAVMAASRAAGIPHLPGAATATEVQHAKAAGCDWVKVFPAGTLGTAWFRAMQGPFHTMNFLATGGVSLAAAPDYLAAGVRVVAFGAAATDAEHRQHLRDLVTAPMRAAVNGCQRAR